MGWVDGLFISVGRLPTMDPPDPMRTTGKRLIKFFKISKNLVKTVA
jgi:hypothetical protein